VSAQKKTKESPVRLDLELCKACGICAAVCPKHVFDLDDLGYPSIARPEVCNNCLLCELHCPDFAIEVERPARRARLEPLETPEPGGDGHKD
jgi:2-oxoglutarate ferredoxin oxidoreductase subunit delta